MKLWRLVQLRETAVFAPSVDDGRLRRGGRGQAIANGDAGRLDELDFTMPEQPDPQCTIKHLSPESASLLFSHLC